MKDGNQKKSKLSWSKTLVRKWFNIKSKAHDFHADDAFEEVGDSERRKSFTERESCTIKRSKTERSTKRNLEIYRRPKFEFDGNAHVTEVQDYRVFVATWNVGAKSPPDHLSLNDWLHASPPADIYVLGFQEIVPLNAGNVLGAEDNGPAVKWLSLIRKTLNDLPGASGCGGYQMHSPIPDPIIELDSDFEGSTRQKAKSFFSRPSFHSLSRSLRMDNDVSIGQPRIERRLSVCDRVMLGNRLSICDATVQSGSSDDENDACDSPTGMLFSPLSSSVPDSLMEERKRSSGLSQYCLVASKQMVGIFLTVWVRSEARDDVKNLKVSCVGRGLMGYLGNKGSISISMSVHQTTFCFVCSHLTSGQKEGDELRRNSDVAEILRKTRFPRIHGLGNENSPETILDHDRIIWLGDLNYRIALSYRAAKAHVEMHNWRALLENDQLRIERRRGRVFQGWREGRIYFPPTYKYMKNSDRYAGDDMHPKEKRRTPAWCDRILWYGRGLNQLSYARAESRFSDHRPVYSIFIVEVESSKHNWFSRSMACPTAKVDVEELLPHTHAYRGLDFF